MRPSLARRPKLHISAQAISSVQVTKRREGGLMGLVGPYTGNQAFFFIFIFFKIIFTEIYFRLYNLQLCTLPPGCGAAGPLPPSCQAVGTLM